MDGEISAEVAGQSSEDELRSLFDWLQRENPGLGRVELTDRRLTGLKRYAGVRWTLDTACPGSARNRQSFSSLFALP